MIKNLVKNVQAAPVQELTLEFCDNYFNPDAAMLAAAEAAAEACSDAMEAFAVAACGWTLAPGE